MSKEKPCAACLAKPKVPCGCQVKSETELEERHEAISEPSALENPIGKQGECLPWVRIEKDPKRFATCLAEARKLGQIDNAKTLVPLVKPFMERQDQEVFIVVLLDTQLYIRGITELARGERDRVSAPIPDMLRVAIVDGAMAFIVLHNHPSGKAKPSQADRELTKAIKKAAECIDILLLDHIVIGTNEYFSFKEHKLL